MSFFDDVFDKLFRTKDSGVPEIVHETLERSESEIQAYHHWRQSESGIDLIRDVENAYFLKKSGLESRLEVHLLDTDYSNGFAVTYNADIETQQFKFFFDFLREQTMALGYRLAQKDRRVLDKNTYMETIEKWYLKPPRKNKKNELVDQMYGNLHIEHIEIDGKPNYIKLMANIYQDRLYTKALPFDAFINEIFDL